MNMLFQTIANMGSLLSENIPEEELSGRLSQNSFNALRQAGLYKLYLPESLGGLESDPMTVAKITEQVARYNPAAAWSVMVANISNWFFKFLPANEVESICGQSENGFVAGTFAAPVKATEAAGGYILEGRSPLCSGVYHADWIGLLSMVFRDGQPVMSDGIPEMRGAFIKREDCEIQDTWQSIGMSATDSNDVTVKDKFVPTSRTFTLSPDPETSHHYKGSLYKFPLTGILSCSLIAPVGLAIATNAVEELKLLTGKVPSGSASTLKEKTAFQRHLARTEGLVRSARTFLHQTIADGWRRMQSGQPATMEDKATLLLAASHSNLSCVKAVDLVFSASGTTGIYRRNKISRHFTDMQVVRHHGFANENRFDTAAQMFLGLQPDFMPVTL